MIDRGMAKWAPFNSVVPGTVMVNDVLKKKNVVQMPMLSEDQINDMEKRIIVSYNNQSIVKVKYFRSGRYYVRNGKITNIDCNYRKIILNGNFPVYFSQIIEIK